MMINKSTTLPVPAKKFTMKDNMSCDEDGTIHAFLYNRSLRKIAIVPLHKDGDYKELSFSSNDPRYSQLKIILKCFKKEESIYLNKRTHKGAVTVSVHAIIWENITLKIFDSFFNFKVREKNRAGIANKNITGIVKNLKEKVVMLKEDGETNLSLSFDILAKLIEKNKKDMAKKHFPMVYERASGINSYLRPLLDTVREIYINS